MQNLVSRIAGLNNEEMSNRGIGMGAAMAYTVHSIGAQFKSNNEANGGFVNRIKNVTNRTSENSSSTSRTTNISQNNESKTSNTTKNENTSKKSRNFFIWNRKKILKYWNVPC